jgi:hypothetical protein
MMKYSRSRSKMNICKRIISCFLIILCILNIAIPAAAAGTPGLYFQKRSVSSVDFAALISYTGTEPEIFIPRYALGLPVKEVQELKGVPTWLTKEIVTGITFPDGLETIEPNVFSGFGSLKRVFIPDSVTDIGRNAFLNCHPDFTIYCNKDSAAYNHAVANGYKYILYDTEYTEGSYKYKILTDSEDDTAYTVITAYTGTQAILTLPKTLGGLPVREIGDSAFLNRSALRELHIRTDITFIAGNAFSGCDFEILTIFCGNNSAAHEYAVSKGLKYVIYEKLKIELLKEYLLGRSELPDYLSVEINKNGSADICDLLKYKASAV